MTDAGSNLSADGLREIKLDGFSKYPALRHDLAGHTSKLSGICSRQSR